MKLGTEVIVVGSGVGGASVAKELAKKDRRVLILEKGPAYAPQQMGSEFHAFKFYDKCGLWSRTKEGIIYYRTIMAGGTSIVSCGNAVRSLERELKRAGIDLKKEFRETENELGVKCVPPKFLGPGTKKIMQAAQKVGVKMLPMPKLINFKKCVSCGNCVVGCLTGAKWSALTPLKEARKRGASLITGINVTKVLISRGRAIGIEGFDSHAKKIQFFAPKVILACGGIGTPIILENSKIKAGRKLFLDLFTVTIGLTKDSGLSKELTMAAVDHSHKGFILSPFIDPPFALASVIPASLRQHLNINIHRDRLLGIMVKIEDDSKGRVYADGRIEKKLTKRDLSRLEKGAEISRKILIAAGAEPNSIVTTRIRGAHPGGTAAIGEVVNKNLEVKKIKGLYVSDASVLPAAPGLPPIVTIVALAKRLAKIVNKK
ncbi:MAG: GMC family oxidoreductase N-terminal domain-containing protein [Candidatus Omnitrophota bacterium]|jgi:choline dehydrogenase-like flavoprotein